MDSMYGVLAATLLGGIGTVAAALWVSVTRALKIRGWRVGACLLLIATAIAGCGGADGAPPAQAGSASQGGGQDSETAEGLSNTVRLALGIFLLEETEHAVTPDQAAALLPLWQALQGGVTAEEEVAAVLRGIEGAMSQDQLAAIANLQLTQQDLETWIAEEGLDARPGFPGGEEGAAGQSGRRRALGEGGIPGGGEMPSAEELPPEMATRMAERQSMSDKEREALRATAQAGGGLGRGLRAGAAEGTAPEAGAMNPFRFLLRPLIILLETRAETDGT